MKPSTDRQQVGQGQGRPRMYRNHGYLRGRTGQA